MKEGAIIAKTAKKYTKVTKHDGKHKESMESAKEDDGSIDLEVVDSKYLRVSEGEHEYADELGECDATEHGGAHLHERDGCTLASA